MGTDPLVWQGVVVARPAGAGSTSRSSSTGGPVTRRRSAGWRGASGPGGADLHPGRGRARRAVPGRSLPGPGRVGAVWPGAGAEARRGLLPVHRQHPLPADVRARLADPRAQGPAGPRLAPRPPGTRLAWRPRRHGRPQPHPEPTRLGHRPHLPGCGASPAWWPPPRPTAWRTSPRALASPSGRGHGSDRRRAGAGAGADGPPGNPAATPSASSATAPSPSRGWSAAIPTRCGSRPRPPTRSRCAPSATPPAPSKTPTSPTSRSPVCNRSEAPCRHGREPRVLALEGDGDGVGGPVAVLGQDQVGLALAR